MRSPRAAAGLAARRLGLRSDPLDAPLRTLPSEAEVYRGLSPSALQFDLVRTMKSSSGVTLVLPSIRASRLSAGPMTAIRFAVMLAERMQRPLRIATTDHWRGGPTDDRAEQSLVARIERSDVAFHHLGLGSVLEVGQRELWVATHWRTALMLKVAVDLRRLDPSDVVYLIQDYEPAFNPWSADWALAQSTYHAGFTHVVNSAPLARFLRNHEQVSAPPELTIGPDLDLERLQHTAERRAVSGDIGKTVFVYGRPSVVRNMYPLCLAALRHAGRVAPFPFTVKLAGEHLDEVPRIAGVDVVALGKLDHDGYYELMATSGLALSLMLSPHPSHPPLDWAVSGGLSITNTFEDYRSDLHPRVLASPPTPNELGDLLAQGMASFEPSAFTPLPDPLGRTLGDVADSVTRSRT